MGTNSFSKFKANSLTNEQGLWNKDGSFGEKSCRIFPDSSINLTKLIQPITMVFDRLEDP